MLLTTSARASSEATEWPSTNSWTCGSAAATPPASGAYYVRAASGSGLSVSLCDSDYSLVLTSFNPSATPVPSRRR